MKSSALATALLLCAGTAAADPPDWLADRAARLFQRVYARPAAECPAGLDGVGAASGAACAAYDRGIEHLKKTLKQFDDRPNRAVTQVKEGTGGLPGKS